MSGNGFIRRGPMAADVFEAQFTQIHNAVFRDARMSFKAKGIFGLISTHRDGYGLSIEALVASSTDGTAAVRTGLKELEALGYLKRTQHRNDGPTEDDPDTKKGTFGAVEYFITDMPDGLTITIDAPTGGETRNRRSEPSCENRTTEDDEESRRSEPSCDFPRADNPRAEKPRADDRRHKNTTPQNTISLSGADGPQTSPPVSAQAVTKTEERESRAAREAPPRDASASGEEPDLPVPQQRAAGASDELVDVVLSGWASGAALKRPPASVRDQLAGQVAELAVDYTTHAELTAVAEFAGARRWVDLGRAAMHPDCVRRLEPVRPRPAGAAARPLRPGEAAPVECDQGCDEGWLEQPGDRFAPCSCLAARRTAPVT